MAFHFAIHTVSLVGIPIHDVSVDLAFHASRGISFLNDPQNLLTILWHFEDKPQDIGNVQEEEKSIVLLKVFLGVINVAVVASELRKSVHGSKTPWANVNLAGLRKVSV